jgi:archaellum component FlaC
MFDIIGVDMNINKAHWSTKGDNLRLSMPFAKVDEERRIVSGFATLDNLDKQDDIVTQEASVAAFEKFKGNIREMHQPLAVGKLVSFKQDRFFDPTSKKFYNGVYVSAYISKGAQDTWEKVLDGTLSSFSIGGNIHKWDDAIDESTKKSIRIIKDYDLFELSLVDSPANQLANILSVQKNADGQTTVTGSSSEVVLENVFWDSENGIVSVSENEAEVSPISGIPMKNIGFVEKSDNEKAEMIKFLVDSAKGIRTIKMTKEVNPMTEDTNVTVEDASVETPAEVEPSTEAVVDIVEAAPETQTEDAAEVETEKTLDLPETEIGESPKNESEAQADHAVADATKAEEVVAKTVSDLKDSLANAFGDLSATVKSISDTVAELTKSLADVKSHVATVATEVADVKGNFNEFGKRVDAVEQDTAFRKSGDLGEIVQEMASMPTQKSLWGGRFLKNTDLFQ